MSNEETLDLSHAIETLRTEVLAVVGRWAITIIGSCIALSIAAASQWFPTLGRIERLEGWSQKRETEYPVSQYNQFRENLEGRLSKIETTQARQGEDIREILSLLNRQP